LSDYRHDDIGPAAFADEVDRCGFLHRIGLLVVVVNGSAMTLM